MQPRWAEETSFNNYKKIRPLTFELKRNRNNQLSGPVSHSVSVCVSVRRSRRWGICVWPISWCPALLMEEWQCGKWTQLEKRYLYSSWHDIWTHMLLFHVLAEVEKVHNFLTWVKVQILLVKYYSVTSKSCKDRFLLKAAVRSFSSLSPSLFEICNCSYLRNYQLYVGCTSAWNSADESNVLRWVCGCQSPRRCGYGHSESQNILFWSLTNIRIFNGKWRLNK